MAAIYAHNLRGRNADAATYRSLSTFAVCCALDHTKAHAMQSVPS
jgi:hypothetical protein